MQRGYAPEWTLSGSYLIRGADPNMIMNCIDALKVDAWKSHLVAQDISVVPGGAFDQTEKWYGTEYHVENVSPALLEVMEEDYVSQLSCCVCIYVCDCGDCGAFLLVLIFQWIIYLSV